MELGEQRRAGQDEDRAQHERADDAPEQHPVLELAGDREVGEDDQEDEQVVDRERVLDQVAGDELEPDAGAELPEQPPREQRGEPDTEADPEHRLARLDDVGLAIEDAEVEHQDGEHPGEEDGPEQRRADRRHERGSLAC